MLLSKLEINEQVRDFLSIDVHIICKIRKNLMFVIIIIL